MARGHPEGPWGPGPPSTLWVMAKLVACVPGVLCFTPIRSFSPPGNWKSGFLLPNFGVVAGPEEGLPGAWGVCPDLPTLPQATATSSSTSVRCWAPTSSWRPCWLTWGLAEPGWPRRTPHWAWRALSPRWAWRWPGTCSSSRPSQPFCSGPPVPVPCCRVPRRRGARRSSNSEPISEAALEGGSGQALVPGRSPDPDLKCGGASGPGTE